MICCKFNKSILVYIFFMATNNSIHSLVTINWYQQLELDTINIVTLLVPQLGLRHRANRTYFSKIGGLILVVIITGLNTDFHQKKALMYESYAFALYMKYIAIYVWNAHFTKSTVYKNKAICEISTSLFRPECEIFFSHFTLFEICFDFWRPDFQC